MRLAGFLLGTAGWTGLYAGCDLLFGPLTWQDYVGVTLAGLWLLFLNRLANEVSDSDRRVW